MTADTQVSFEVLRLQTYVPCVDWSWQPSKPFVVESVHGDKVQVWDPTGGQRMGGHRWIALRNLHETGTTKQGKERKTGWRLHAGPPGEKQDLCVVCMRWVDVELIAEGMRYTWRGTCAPCKADIAERYGFSPLTKAQACVTSPEPTPSAPYPPPREGTAVPAQHDLAIEAELWDTFAGSAFREEEVPEFHWTPYTGHGPGPELLGDPRRVMELGSGPGRSLAYLAQRGVEAHGLDLSPRMVETATGLWTESTGAVFHQGDALTYLAASDTVYDAVYSIFGPAWFADPSKLFPLVRARLRDGGVFVFSQAPAIPGAYGPQGMYKNGFAGRAMFTYRYSYRPPVWERLLTRAGFATARAEVLDAPKPGYIGTLVVTARA